MTFRPWRRARVVVASGVLAVLTVLVAHALGTLQVPSSAGAIIISIPGVPGPYCVYGIEKRLRERPGIDRVDLLWADERIRVVLSAGSPLTEEDVRDAVERSEYPYDYSVSRAVP